jgi:DNA-binding CsgD family transcriptional regulator
VLAASVKGRRSAFNVVSSTSARSSCTDPSVRAPATAPWRSCHYEAPRQGSPNAGARGCATRLPLRCGVSVTGPSRRAGAGHNVGSAVLSAREAEVVDLVAQGLTNRQVAAELFVTDRAVETHLAHVFSKLGVGSRAAVAVAWERARPAAWHG